MIEQEMGHGRNEEDGHRALGLHHSEPSIRLELGLVDPTQPQLHRGVDEGDAGEGEHGAGVEPSSPAP
jgi:hypothetical protein